MSFLSCEEMLAAAHSQNISLSEAILRSDLAESRLTEAHSREIKVINKSEKEAVSEETVKSEDGFKPADNADTTEDNTETINLEEVK